MMRRIISRAGRGQSIIEFALSLPFLILLLAGVVDFANAYRIYIAMTNAAREGAYEIVTTGRDANYCARVAESLGSSITASCAREYPSAPGCAGGAPVLGCPVRVTVSYSAETYFAGILGLSTIPMNATAEMMVLKGT